VLHLNSIAPVPDLAVLLFATDLEHTPLDLAAVAAAAAAAAAAASAREAAAEHTESAQADSSSSANNPYVAIRKKQQEELLREGNQLLTNAYLARRKALASDPAQAESRKPAQAVLLGGYARYLLERPSDLAALLQLREHMQLLLQMKVRVVWLHTPGYTRVVHVMLCSGIYLLFQTCAWFQQHGVGCWQ
jgi:hypothetical protein